MRTRGLATRAAFALALILLVRHGSGQTGSGQTGSGSSCECSSEETGCLADGVDISTACGCSEHDPSTYAGLFYCYVVNAAASSGSVYRLD